jgi:hypothetical protein
MLGHRDLPQFVGEMSQVLYRSESDWNDPLTVFHVATPQEIARSRAQKAESVLRSGAWTRSRKQANERSGLGGDSGLVKPENCGILVSGRGHCPCLSLAPAERAWTSPSVHIDPHHKTLVLRLQA